MEFASHVWQTSKSIDGFNKLQTKGLTLCLCVPEIGADDALEVEASVLTLDLRRELLIREIGKIMSKDNTEPMRGISNDWKKDHNSYER